MSDEITPHPKPERAKHFIREWRKKRGMTQEDLASEIGVSIPTISQIETYKTGFTGETLSALAEALHVTRGDLLENDPDKDSTLWQVFASFKEADIEKKEEVIAVVQAMLKSRAS